MKLCRLIVSVLFIAMASCAAAKEAILFLNAHPDDTDGASEVDVSTEDCMPVETFVKLGGGDLRGVAQFDVRDFGAKGDGVTKDTTAVQRAIDACVAMGGGRVVITNGTFLVAPITLGCGVELHLARGAGLLVHGIWRTTRTDPGSDTSEPMPCHGNGDKTLSGAREPRVFDAIGASGLPTMTAAA